ncbi:lipopolysaccharide heptosyltransferase II [Helicobacter sp. 11S02596-1]|uniref:lipopolysaccharide heptosyltransferase II n=1 Tax=Helicobacter sp. 11S02596-1 TaxID=1476194 RepID=UPI000BA602D8|nr:lipopolysaccharide heptosyltransferase II [Helicobacter sp. 11S02596-1]PAF42485.1 lipopolysaccharide heptosyltransferase II [Helicobacter sp. 11S02596-1]
MKILLRLPNWLGDAVMATPALELLKNHYPKASLSIVGTQAVCGLFERDPCVQAVFVDETKKSKSRLLATYQLAKQIGKHDIAITFTNNIFSALLLFWTKTPLRIGYAKNLRSPFLSHPLAFHSGYHQVLTYAHLLSPLFSGAYKQNQDKMFLDATSLDVPALKLIASKKPYASEKKTKIGINPGAAFGSAKRWLKEYFAETILSLIQKDYEVVLFGNQSDEEMMNEIITIVKKLATQQKILENITDLTGKTTITSLIDTIATLDLFITNDSGPMHIATALQIPLIAIFGPTNDKETSPWRHKNAVILNRSLPCAPCKKRTCPLDHHNCMKLITPDEVIAATNKLLARKP